MQFKPLVVLSGLCAVASAHFHLQYPPPRGVFNMDNEPTFCDGYDSSISNRTAFPLSSGIISLTSEHPIWTIGVIISTSSNPQSFQSFSQVVPFFQVTGEGAFCFPVDFTASDVSGLTDGANVTIQLEFDGGDGSLFQCADLTLNSSATVPSGTSCTNATGDSVQLQPSNTLTIPSGSGTPASATSSGAPAATSSSAALAQSAVAFSSVLGLAGVVLAML